MKKPTKTKFPYKQGDPEYSGVYKYMFKSLDIIWSVMPEYLGCVMATVMVFLAGSTMRGDWLFILVHFIKHFKPNENDTDNLTTHETPEIFNEWTLESLKLQNLPNFLIIYLISSYAMYFFVCGFLMWYFYIKQRDKSHEWKCQPGKFLTPELDQHAITVGSINVGFGGAVFAVLACYVYNGGHSTIYFKPDEYGWAYLILSLPIHFIYQDGGAYYAHRILHMPLVYKHIHKWHHYYKQPTAFTTTAMHPLELLLFQSFMLLPVFTVPLHAGVYVITLMYIYYYGMITHSGIDLKPIWPWALPASYHDNHHQYFHVNFAANTSLFDRLHGTMRKKDHVYNETIFGGKGIELKTASEHLKKEHAEELAAELGTKKL